MRAHSHTWPAAHSCYSSTLSSDASVELQLTALRCLLACLQFCCEGSPLSCEQLRLAFEAGVIVGVHVRGGKPGLLVSTIGPAPAAPGAPSPPSSPPYRPAACRSQAYPFAVDASHPQSDSALKKLQKLCSRGRQPPCNKLLDDWLLFLAQRVPVCAVGRQALLGLAPLLPGSSAARQADPAQRGGHAAAQAQPPVLAAHP